MHAAHASRPARTHGLTRLTSVAVFTVSVSLLFACAGIPTVGTAQPAAAASSANGPTQPNVPPAFMIGTFDDDYGGSFAITSTDFLQLPRGRFHIVQWSVTQQYFIAQNDSLNRSDPGKWTRIDWLLLTEIEPYTWAFCYSAYNANTRAEAESATMAKRDTPKTGCGGFPFTRMKPRS